MIEDQPDGLAGRFEPNRTHLRAVAYRMLGSPSEVWWPARFPRYAQWVRTRTARYGRTRPVPARS